MFSIPVSNLIVPSLSHIKWIWQQIDYFVGIFAILHKVVVVVALIQHSFFEAILVAINASTKKLRDAKGVRRA
jgi:hypothetical protein